MIWKTETRLIQSRRPLPSVLSWSMTRESKCPRNSVSSPIKQWHPIPSSIPIGWKKKVCLLWEIFLIRWKLCQVHNVLYAKPLAFKKKFVCICCCLKYGNRQPLTLAMLKVRFGVRLIVFELFPAMSTVSLLKCWFKTTGVHLVRLLLHNLDGAGKQIVFFPVCPSFLAHIDVANVRTWLRFYCATVNF